ncbi:MAG: hypothetical protein QG570_68, partial [Patescibacteria group bacterium]|nr:hypothetical protein [Patescibacteria group bacterium]
IIKPIFERASGGNTSYSLPRYILGGLIALAALVFLVLNIKKIAQQGLASIGRNPLANKMIIFSVIINLTITLVVTLLGIGLAYLVFAL